METPQWAQSGQVGGSAGRGIAFPFFFFSLRCACLCNYVVVRGGREWRRGFFFGFGRVGWMAPGCAGPGFGGGCVVVLAGSGLVSAAAGCCDRPLQAVSAGRDWTGLDWTLRCALPPCPALHASLGAPRLSGKISACRFFDSMILL